MKQKRTLILLTLAASMGSTAFAPGQSSASENDPFDRSKRSTAPTGAVANKANSQNLIIRYETFSMDLKDAAKLMRQDIKEADLYTQIVAEVGSDDVTQESFTILRTKTNQRCTSEAISETIYPTEFEPPELPNVVGVQIVPPADRHGDGSTRQENIPDLDKLKDAPDFAEQPFPATPSTPTAYETRNLGITIEAEASIDPETGMVQLNIAPEYVRLVGHNRWGQGLSTARQPEFESQRLTANVSVAPDVPSLLGTFNRSPQSVVDQNSAVRVWFAFVTVSVLK